MAYLAISLIIGLIIVGFALWLVGVLPLDATIKTIIKGVVILVVVLWVLDAVLHVFGYGGLGHMGGCGRPVR